MAVAEITEIESRGEVNTLLNLCTAIEEAWLKELFPDDFVDAGGVLYDETAKRVLARKERRFRDLVLESKQTAEEPPEGEAAALLARGGHGRAASRSRSGMSRSSNGSSA